jgi:hypothetical protein
MKGLARRNTHMKYESSTTHPSKVMTKVKVFEKVKLQGQTSQGQSWYKMKGHARRNTHVKYKSTSTYKSNVITKDKVFEKKTKLEGKQEAHGPHRSPE